MEKKKKSTLFTRLFGNRNKVTDFMTEEQLQSPGRLILKNFLHNRLGMIGLIVFLLIFLLVMIGPKFYTLDLSYQDNTQLNVPPGMNMMSIPEGMKHKVADISPGTTYGVGVDTDGNVYTWGYTKITETIDLKNIPEEVQNAKIVNVAAGYDHIVALDENGAIYVWGNRRLGQDMLPDKLQMAAAYGKNLGIKQIEASNQFSAAVTEDGELFLWGNGNQADIKIKKEYQGNIEKVALTARAYIALTKDGAAVYAGFQKDNALVRIPDGLDSGVVDIAASSNAVAAVKEDGTVVVWGTCTNGEKNVPAFESKPVELYGGRYHFTALMDDGEVISWGDNTHGQASVPASFNDKEIVTVYAGFYQNYAVTVDGDVETWGLKGYVCGTDDLGRDVFNRIINGGKVTMTVGAISVIIQLVIGIILGGLAGYFGGWVDNLIMRVVDIFYCIPSMPIIIILGAAMDASRVDPTIRMVYLMLILGFLGWAGIARLVRGQILSLREQEFMTATEACGISVSRRIFRHLIPNVIPQLIVNCTMSLGATIITEATLSFLGLGVKFPFASWGNIMNDVSNSYVLTEYWFIWIPAGICLMLTVLGFNFVGDGLRDAFDPKMKR